MKRALSAILLCVASFFIAAAQEKTVPQPAVVVPPKHESSPDIRQQTFDIVWRTVKEKHFDPTLGGVDWDKVRDQYAPQVTAVKSDSELYKVLQQMLDELHQSHFNIIPPEAIIEDDSKEPQTGSIGIDLRLINGQAVITRVEPGSRAAAAGLRTGFIIKKVDDETVDHLVGRFARSKESPVLIRLRIVRALLNRISGKPETSVLIAYLDKRDERHEVTVQRERLKGEMSPRFGNFPPQYMEFESKRLADGIGYVRFNIFVIPLMEKIRAAIRSMSDAPGIIVDLRGNPGGLGGMATGIAGLLEKKQGSLGTMKTRQGQTIFAVIPQGAPYSGPIVILTDGGSASTSEIFAGGMQEIGRAVVVGERTAGAALPSVFQKLPTGAIFQYAVGDFKTPKGVLIEGRGVVPDVEVKLKRGALLEGRDTQLEAAIEQVKKHARPGAARKAVSRL